MRTKVVLTVDVEPSVFVVVQECDARARGFKDELFIGGAHGVMPAGQTGFDGDVLKDALKEGKAGSSNIELLIANGDFFKTYAINYHEGEKYPHLVRDESKPDILSEIAKPK